VKRPLPSIEDLRERLRYEPETGKFFWRDGRLAGQQAGTLQWTGYRALMFQRKLIAEHRLVWLFEYGQWPNSCIDHVNGKAADNRVGNLRLASAAENARNCRRKRNNVIGLKGVGRVVAKGLKAARWVARISIDGKPTHLGCFGSPEEAHAAYAAAAREHHGKFARVE
jgi:hypothetical protein